MKVDRAKAVVTELGGQTYYFCSEHCLHAFEVGSHGEHDHAHAKHEEVAHAH
jgi:YHS domain-containing protein